MQQQIGQVKGVGIKTRKKIVEFKTQECDWTKMSKRPR